MGTPRAASPGVNRRRLLPGAAAAVGLAGTAGAAAWADRVFGRRLVTPDSLRRRDIGGRSGLASGHGRPRGAA